MHVAKYKSCKIISSKNKLAKASRRLLVGKTSRFRRKRREREFMRIRKFESHASREAKRISPNMTGLPDRGRVWRYSGFNEERSNIGGCDERGALTAIGALRKASCFVCSILLHGRTHGMLPIKIIPRRGIPPAYRDRHECTVRFRFQTFCEQVRAVAPKSRDKMRERVGEYEARAKPRSPFLARLSESTFSRASSHRDKFA